MSEEQEKNGNEQLKTVEYPKVMNGVVYPNPTNDLPKNAFKTENFGRIGTQYNL